MTGIMSEGSASSSVPMYGERSGSRSWPRDGVGPQCPVASPRWYGAVDRKGRVCPAERAQQAGEGL